MASTSGAAQGGQWFPPEWPDRIRALARGELAVPEPRRAATVMLLRDAPAVPEGSGATAGAGAGAGAGGAGSGAPPEVYLLRRRASMAFAGGAYAYPGGSVDPRDERSGSDIGWAGPGPAAWGERLGTSPAVAQAVVCAAVRETFEEAGVLLAGTAAGELVADTTGQEWEDDRRALVSRELSFADLLARRSLMIRDDLLGAWARWVTPEFEKRRYDTWFFAARLPAGQLSRNASTEADVAEWTDPAAAVAGYDRGELLMMPPTIATLRTLADYPTAAAVLEAAARGRDLTPVLAQARIVGGEVVLSWPGHEEFEKRVEPAGPGTPAGRNGAAASSPGEENQ